MSVAHEHRRRAGRRGLAVPARAVLLLSMLLVLVVLVAGPLSAPGRSATTSQTGGDSLAGRLLVATPQMGDPSFAHSVIYLVAHEGKGAMGLVVNLLICESPLALLLVGAELLRFAIAVMAQWPAPVL